MATQRSTFAKLQRDRDKKAKAAAKRERRVENQAQRAAQAEETQIPTEGELSAAELLKLVEQVHQDYENKLIDLDTFDERKAELLARLPID